jgi:hypothetical protein
LVQFEENCQLYHDPLLANDWLLTENEEAEALAALNRLDIARLNEVMTIFTRLIKCLKRNCISCFGRLPMLHTLRVEFESVRATKHAETLMQAVSEHCSATADLNIIFTCWLMSPIGKRYHGVVQRPSMFVTSIEVMWKQGINALARAFSRDVPQMISLFSDYSDSEGPTFELPAICVHAC